jgi:hypothetical protein
MWSFPFRQRGAKTALRALYIAGNEIGRIIETPKLRFTLEEELLEIIKTGQACAD